MVFHRARLPLLIGTTGALAACQRAEPPPFEIELEDVAVVHGGADTLLLAGCRCSCVAGIRGVPHYLNGWSRLHWSRRRHRWPDSHDWREIFQGVPEVLDATDGRLASRDVSGGIMGFVRGDIVAESVQDPEGRVSLHLLG